jgi:hypothetical protein
MGIKSTELRNHLFETLDSAIHGKTFEIVYKGAILTLSSQPNGSKLANAVRRNALLVDADEIAKPDAGLMNEFEMAWAKSDSEL